jgi:hypothetical protein
LWRVGVVLGGRKNPEKSTCRVFMELNREILPIPLLFLFLGMPQEAHPFLCGSDSLRLQFGAKLTETLQFFHDSLFCLLVNSSCLLEMLDLFSDTSCFQAEFPYAFENLFFTVRENSTLLLAAIEFTALICAELTHLTATTFV